MTNLPCQLRMYGIFFSNLSSIMSENAWLSPISFLDSDSLCEDLLFPHSHKPRNNIVLLVGKFLEETEYLRPDRRCARQNMIKTA